MKTIIVFASILAVVLYIAAPVTHAQGRGQGRVPEHSVGQAPGHVDHGDINRPERPEQRRDPEARREERREERGVDRREDRREERTAAKFEDRLERNPELKARLESLLPAGTNLTTAASGFKNQGQFIAALHVSQNLGIPFNDLKARMTGSDPMSLGQAIHDLRPDMPEKQARDEAKRAEKQAKATEKTKSTT